MTLQAALSALSIVLALGVALFTLYRLQKLPYTRDHRPMAPVVALAFAFVMLQLQVVLSEHDPLPRVRDMAWLLWHMAALLEMGFLIHTHTKTRKPNPPYVPPRERDHFHGTPRP